jgi:2-hydroxychromene-2-carboxylate isomerase
LNSLAANRAATWAKRNGAIEAFVRALYSREFAAGADISAVDLLVSCAPEANLDPRELPDALQRQEIKDSLRRATDRAWERGVRGVPSLLVDGVVFYGDDRLEDATEHVAASSRPPAA